MWRTTSLPTPQSRRKSISIHVPRVEDDLECELNGCSDPNFNPRPPCGGRHKQGADSLSVPNFNPRPPCGGRQYCDLQYIMTGTISIHVPRVEDDGFSTAYRTFVCDFNPRPPCGGRRTGCTIRQLLIKFQSTSPVWRTTYAKLAVDLIRRISIHVPRVEDDSPLPSAG